MLNVTSKPIITTTQIQTLAALKLAGAEIDFVYRQMNSFFSIKIPLSSIASQYFWIGLGFNSIQAMVYLHFYVL